MSSSVQSHPPIQPLPQRPSALPGFASPSAGVVTHANVFAVLLLVAVATFANVLDIRPLHGDNLSILSWASRSDATSFLWGIPDSYPEWRPLPYLTISAQYQLVGIKLVESYFAVNLLTWTVAAFCVYAFVVLTTRSRVSGAVVALAILLDPRAVDTLDWITGRQETFTAIFGFLAILLWVTGTDRQSSRWRLIGIYCLLLAASLSKEYGLAFAATLFLAPFIRPRKGGRAIQAVALASVATYVALRLLIVSGASGSYCNQMGFFLSVGNVCYKDLEPSGRLAQQAYNVGATFLGTLLPGVFGGAGELRINPAVLAVSIAWLGVAVLGWVSAPRRTLPMLVLILVNSALSYMLYRERNQTFALMGFYAAAGVGLASLLAWVTARTATRRYSALLLLLPFAWLIMQVPVREDVHAREVAVLNSRDPCSALSNADRYDARLIREIKLKYGMPNPDCAR